MSSVSAQTETVNSKQCTLCNIEKPFADFSLNASNKTDGRRSRCKLCTRTDNFHYGQKYRSFSSRREYMLAYRFGLTVEQYEAMSAAQDHGCAICRRPESGRSNTGSLRMMSVDHDHLTGKIRGLLCGRCNVRFGSEYADPDLIQRAAEYLRYGFEFLGVGNE